LEFAFRRRENGKDNFIRFCLVWGDVSWGFVGNMDPKRSKAGSKSRNEAPVCCDIPLAQLKPFVVAALGEEVYRQFLTSVLRAQTPIVNKSLEMLQL